MNMKNNINIMSVHIALRVTRHFEMFRNRNVNHNAKFNFQNDKSRTQK